MTGRPGTRPRHRLLERQLRKTLGGSPPPELEPFLDAIDDAYRQADVDRGLLERSLELTSDELQERSRHLRAFFESAPFRMGIVELVDDDLLLVSHNAAAADAFGPARATALSMRAAGVPPAVVRSWVEGCATARARGSARIEYVEGEPGDEQRSLSVTLGRVGAWGENEAFCYVIEDVTERRRMMDVVARQERLASLGTLAAGVAHEINTPLACILANVEIALAEAPTADCAAEVVEGLEDARTAVQRLAGIVRDLRSLSRDDPSRRAAIRLADVLSSAVTMVGPQLRGVAELTVDVRDVPPVIGDEARLGQVFINLLQNAAHAVADRPSGERHTIGVRADVEGSVVHVDVTDSGAGIPAEIVGRLFDPFFTTKPVGVGTGLGLSISDAIVRGVGGELRVLRTEPGVGTTFRVTLRRADPPARASSSIPARSVHRPRVLVVDDDTALLAAISRMLRREHEVATASGGRAALAALEAPGHWDVVLCDVVMPDLDGVALYEAAVARREELAGRFVMMTGGARSGRLASLLDRAPTLPLLSKPFALDTLRSAIRARLEAAGLEP